MTTQEMLQIIALGEDSEHQFKRNVTNTESLAAEMVDKDGVFWVKSGSDKRKATTREEIKRMFTGDESLHADEQPVSNTSIDDLDLDYFTC